MCLMKAWIFKRCQIERYLHIPINVIGFTYSKLPNVSQNDADQNLNYLLGEILGLLS